MGKKGKGYKVGNKGIGNISTDGTEPGTERRNQWTWLIPMLYAGTKNGRSGAVDWFSYVQLFWCIQFRKRKLKSLRTLTFLFNAMI